MKKRRGPADNGRVSPYANGESNALATVVESAVEKKLKKL
jgi:hypothetical protein